MTIGKIIRQLRESHNLTQYELAAIAKVSDKAVSSWENDASIPRMGPIERMADYFGVPKSYLIGEEMKVMQSAIRIPVLGSIPAGVPIEAIEDIIDWEELPLSWGRGGKEYFGLVVRGNSMYPRYEDGDVIIVRRQDDCESGQDAVIMINGDDATFKRVRKDMHGIALQPINPDYEILSFTNDDIIKLPVRILGVVVELRRKMV